MKKVIICHPVIDISSDASTIDVLDQVRLVEGSLAELGIPYTTLAITNGRVWEHATKLENAIVFNLLEAPPGAMQLQVNATAVLELLGIPFTGASASAMWLTSDKITTRALLQANNLPIALGGRIALEKLAILEQVPPPWIIKPAWEDASVGLEGNPICYTSEEAIKRTELLTACFPNQPLLLEHFLPGREFNVSLLERENEVEILPIAEIVFDNFPSDIPPLVNYEAKWESDSFTYIHTWRRFPTEDEDGELLHSIREMSKVVWEICDLSGYARIDLRLNEAGIPHILEVNANPCLSPDAGFLAAAAQAGLSPTEVIRRILNGKFKMANYLIGN